jgi:hypothetical protein
MQVWDSAALKGSEKKRKQERKIYKKLRKTKNGKRHFFEKKIIPL